MILDLSRITLTCFASSYAVTLALEISRLWFRAAIRHVFMLIFAGAGFFAHTAYLVTLAQNELRRGIVVYGSWYDWCLLAAWVLAGAYLGLTLRRPRNSVGIFILPLILAVLGISYLCQGLPPFPSAQARSYWQWIHGISLLIGTVSVVLGFATGVMYLVQSYRLKHKLPPRQGLQLPSLEWLQRFNREALLFSTIAMAFGVISGVTLTVSSKGSVLWTDPVVITAGMLFVWLVGVMLFESVYRPARQGRKVAYLTMASFVFLSLSLLFVLLGGHARP